MTVFKGNNAYATFTRIGAGGTAITTTPKEIYFTVKKKPEDTEVLFQKTLGNGIDSIGGGKYRVSILPTDTDNLPFGYYWCDVKVINEDNLKFTIVPPQEFVVAKVITLSGDEV